MKKSLILLSVFLTSLLPATAQSSVASFRNTPVVECLGVELDGSQTLRVSGTGKNRADAKKQARKNAVMAVLFQGIRGAGPCDQRPLINEANARDKYEEYFNIFFLDDGEYSKYVSMVDQKRLSRDKRKNKYVHEYTITVRVLRAELKARLKADGILQ